MESHNTKLISVPNHSLPSPHQLPPMDPDSPPNWDCSLWLLAGALVMGLDTYFPPLTRPASFGRPLMAAILVLHWMASWWMVPLGWESEFVSLDPSLKKLVIMSKKKLMRCLPLTITGAAQY
ncbi:hypothetical protein DSO57_1031911 [Entomophthora muscae]|uniref:Uncharacterized protein n=1 Tax=Entomophthora muscae TaxID=34485 RepID=A0ACC2RRM4_9FUNG|nr:hypothetical protein DSO57_1031911 [Entomophthora muscae]